MGLLVTLVFLALVLRSVDLAEVWLALQGADYVYVAPAFLCTLAGYLVRTKRWQIILAPSKRIPFNSAFGVLMIGFAANNVLPARIGELVRAYALSRREGLSKTLSLSTIMVERVLDGVTIMGFLAVLSLVYPLPGWGMIVARTGALIFGVAGLGVILLLVQESLALRLLALLLRPLPARLGARVQRLAGFFISGLHALRSGRSLLAIVALSLLVWSLEATAYLMLIYGFHLPIDDTHRVYAAVFLLTVINLGNIVPASPGYVGSFEGFTVLALTTFSQAVSSDMALALAAVSHTYQWLLVTLVGVFYLWREGLSLRTLGQAVESEPAAQPDKGMAAQQEPAEDVTYVA